MKKTIIIITVVSVFVLSFSACKKLLEQTPRSSTDAGSFYNNDASAQLALNSAYGATRSNDFLIWGINNFPTDFTKINETGQNSDRDGIAYYQHLSTNSTVTSIWRDHFRVVVRSNAVINGVRNNSNVTLANLYEAEARVLRGLSYFDLVRMFGAVPKVEFGAGDYDPGYEQLARLPEDSIWNFIISDLEFGLKYCDIKSKLPFGRVTKGFTKALLAKVYLTLGSYRQRDATGDGKEYFQKCLDLCREIKASGEYNLVPYFPDNFTLESERNSEVMFAINFETGVNLGGTVGEHMGVAGNGNILGSVFPGMIIATDYAWQINNLYDYKDTIRRLWTMEKVKYTASLPPFTSATNPAFESFDDTLIVPQSAHYPARTTGAAPAAYPARGLFFQNRFKATFPATMITKYRRNPRLPANYIYSNYPLDLPVIRYAEVLLMLAEAANEVAGMPTPEAYAAVNEVRDRARNRNNVAGKGLRDDVYPRIIQKISSNVPDFAGMSYTEFRDEMLQERSRELFGEWGCRWYDLVRKGLLVQKVNPVYNGWICTYLGNNRPEFRFGRTQVINVQPYHKFLPIPQDEIIKNSKLIQNPGYPN